VFEIVMAVLAVVAVAKVADADDQSPILWGGIAVGLIVASMFIVPWPFARVGVGWVLAFAAMFTYKVVANR
jgi:hypothetical protein